MTIYLGVVITLLVVLGLWLGVLALDRLRRHRHMSAASQALLAVSLLSAAAVLGGLALNLHTYARLTHEQDLAELAFRELAPQRFEVTINYAGGDRRDRYELYGDEWQLDARVLKWHGFANLLGLNTQYRVERISGRYRDVDAERVKPRTVYALASNTGIDVWRLARGRSLAFVDASYGSATYLPMRDGARFAVRVTQSGLLARPSNAAGAEAIVSWE